MLGRGESTVRLKELRSKEVINVTDGHRLGNVIDVELDPAGHIVALVVPGPFHLWRWLWRGNDYVIPWDHVYRIGYDVVLVELAVTPSRAGHSGA